MDGESNLGGKLRLTLMRSRSKASRSPAGGRSPSKEIPIHTISTPTTVKHNIKVKKNPDGSLAGLPEEWKRLMKREPDYMQYVKSHGDQEEVEDSEDVVRRNKRSDKKTVTEMEILSELRGYVEQGSPWDFYIRAR